jgi:glycosyltransferase involved in cell wall biosynthesis
MNKVLTIVIPCKNEAHNIIATLKFLFKQKLNCQIYIADSSDDEKSKEILHDFVVRSHRTIKIIKGGLPAIARNNGAKLVKTPFVLFLDADIFIKDKTLIKDCLDLALHKNYDLVTCKFKTVNNEYWWIYRIFDIIQWISSKTTPFAIGGFMLFNTETFRKLGGFNEEDKIAEDYHISSKINPQKFKIVNRYVHTTARRFKKKGFWYMTKLAFNSWLNRNNDDWFKKDYGYWK